MTGPAAIAVLLLVRALHAADYSWQESHAKVLSTGDLEWAPEAFVFERGESVRHIDFEGGRDTNDGLTRQTPWQHHPWDTKTTIDELYTWQFDGPFLRDFTGRKPVGRRDAGAIEGR